MVGGGGRRRRDEDEVKVRTTEQGFGSPGK
jgi:hypothetical protein